jgi:AcrR family transcriptional regulator
VPVPARRTYDSPRRRATAERTRAAVFEAATDMFARQGWAATGMRDIAREANVSVETVYATARSKSELLLRVIDVAIVGDDEPVPLAQRPEFVAVGIGDRQARVEAVARLLTGLNRRVARLDRTFAHAAAGDADLAARLAETRERQRSTYRDGLTLVLEREPAPALVDGLWALGSAEVYLLLVESSGWTPEQYQSWLGDIVHRLVEHLPEENT